MTKRKVRRIPSDSPQEIIDTYRILAKFQKANRKTAHILSPWILPYVLLIFILSDFSLILGLAGIFFGGYIVYRLEKIKDRETLELNSLISSNPEYWTRLCKNFMNKKPPS